MNRFVRVSPLAVLLVLSTVGAETSWAQEPPLSRVHIVTFPADETDVQMRPALDAAADTMALTLPLLEHYEVATDYSSAWDSPEAYIEAQTVGTVDTVIALSGRRERDELVLDAEVRDPLTNAVEITRSERIESIMMLFESVDRIVVGLLGELSGQRIAFGSLAVNFTGWDPSPTSDLSYVGVSWNLEAEARNGILDPNDYGRPLMSEFELLLDGTKSERGFQIERVLIGSHVVEIVEIASGIVVYAEEINIEEGESLVVQARVPVPVRGDRDGLRTLAHNISQSAAMYVNREPYPVEPELFLLNWRNNQEELERRLLEGIPGFGVPERWTAAVASGRVLLDAAILEHEVRSQWAEPNHAWYQGALTISSNLRDVRHELDDGGSSSSMEDILGVADAVLHGIETAVPELYSLRALRHLNSGDLGTFETMYRDTDDWHTLPVPPSWLAQDIVTLNTLFEEYEKGPQLRPQLYRSMTYGGVASALLGAGLWGAGIGGIEQNKTLRGTGIGIAGLGVGSYFASIYQQQRDITQPERLLTSRLDTYFGPRLELLSELEARHTVLPGLPVPGYHEAVLEPDTDWLVDQSVEPVTGKQAVPHAGSVSARSERYPWASIDAAALGQFAGVGGFRTQFDTWTLGARFYSYGRVPVAAGFGVGLGRTDPILPQEFEEYEGVPADNSARLATSSFVEFGNRWRRFSVGGVVAGDGSTAPVFAPYVGFRRLTGVAIPFGGGSTAYFVQYSHPIGKAPDTDRDSEVGPNGRDNVHVSYFVGWAIPLAYQTTSAEVIASPEYKGHLFYSPLDVGVELSRSVLRASRVALGFALRIDPRGFTSIDFFEELEEEGFEHTDLAFMELDSFASTHVGFHRSISDRADVFSRVGFAVWQPGSHQNGPEFGPEGEVIEEQFFPDRVGFTEVWFDLGFGRLFGNGRDRSRIDLSVRLVTMLTPSTWDSNAFSLVPAFRVYYVPGRRANG